jgi:hypothetical protein
VFSAEIINETHFALLEFGSVASLAINNSLKGVLFALVLDADTLRVLIHDVQHDRIHLFLPASPRLELSSNARCDVAVVWQITSI